MRIAVVRASARTSALPGGPCPPLRWWRVTRRCAPAVSSSNRPSTAPHSVATAPPIEWSFEGCGYIRCRLPVPGGDPAHKSPSSPVCEHPLTKTAIACADCRRAPAAPGLAPPSHCDRVGLLADSAASLPLPRRCDDDSTDGCGRLGRCGGCCCCAAGRGADARAAAAQ